MDRPVQEWRKQAFDLAAESTKQMITVATGVVTATVLFSKDLSGAARWIAYASWFFLIVSVLAGVGVLFNLSGNLNNAADGVYRAPDLRASGLRFVMISQIGLFLTGVVLVFVFGLFAVRSPGTSGDDKKITVNCVAPAQNVTNNVGQDGSQTQKTAQRKVRRGRGCKVSR
jgi:hypothetical protein